MKFILMSLLLVYSTLVLGTIIKFKVKDVPAYLMHVAFLMPIVILLWAPVSAALQSKNTIKGILIETIKNYEVGFKYYPLLVGSAAVRLASKHRNSCHIMEMVWPSFNVLIGDHPPKVV